MEAINRRGIDRIFNIRCLANMLNGYAMDLIQKLRNLPEADERAATRFILTRTDMR